MSILITICSILLAILIFSIVIFVHELGHFVAAKASGVQVNEFAMFMGPAIFKKQKGETLYSIRCIPIGGYCAMEGEDEDTDNPRSFQKAAWWKRLIILVAGSFMNLVIGFLMLMIFFSFQKTVALPVIDDVEPACTVVREGGLQEGDELWKIDGYRVYTSTDALLLLSFESPTHDIEVKRNGEKLVFDDYAMEKHQFYNAQTGENELRYGFGFAEASNDFGTLLGYTADNSVSVVQSVFLSLKMLFTGQAGLQDMAGPVRITQMMAETAAASGTVGNAILNMLYFGGFIAINLCVMNMLPIPALDGGRCVGLLLTTGIEKITRKKLDPKYEGYVHGIGMILLLALMAVILFKDVFYIFK